MALTMVAKAIGVAALLLCFMSCTKFGGTVRTFELVDAGCVEQALGDLGVARTRRPDMPWPTWVIAGHSLEAVSIELREGVTIVSKVAPRSTLARPDEFEAPTRTVSRAVWKACFGSQPPAIRCENLAMNGEQACRD
jgi:hypothetical protein